jgi:xanthosine utilization system XapX-like protein
VTENSEISESNLENSNGSEAIVADEIRLEYIKIQWADIRHSRLQEWSTLGVVAGVMYALVNTVTTESGPRVLLGLLGLLSGIIGASMSWQHHRIFKKKIKVISENEEKIGLDYGEMRNADFPVQILLFLLFGGIACAFAGITIFFVFVNFIPDFSSLISSFVGVVAFLGLFIWTYKKRKTSDN